MAVQGEELASKIEARIKQAIDSVVDDIRVSLDDVREAVNSQFDAALQSVLADAKSLSLQSELEEMLADVSLGEEPVASAPPPAAAPSAGSKELKTAIQEIERGGTQVDVLNALLDQLLVFGSRAALLILKGDTFSGWKGKGFTTSGGNDEMIKRFSAGPGDIAELDRLRLDENVVSWDGASFAQRSNMEAPARAIAVPMVIKDKISAAVYVDSLEADEADLDQNSIELLVYTTGLLIDTLAIRKRVPSPTLSRDTDADPFDSEAEPQLLSQPEAPAAPQPEPTRAAPQPSVAPAPPPAPPSQVEPPAAPQPMPEPELEPELEPEPPQAEPEPAPPAEPPSQPSTQVRPPEPASTQVSPPQPAAPQTPPQPRPAEQAPPTQVRPPAGEGGSTQYVPPPGVTGGFAAKADVGEDAKKHDDARRFARLLVSEIKLYNEGKVDQGRKNGDLYERLKEDIDRSRQMYEDRVPQEVREVSNYFYDELVRILADGNADSLGL